MISLRELQKIFGGEISTKGELLCPGPGHSAVDRSLSIRPTDDAPNDCGVVFNSFAQDDPGDCLAYIREKLNGHNDRPGS